MVFDYLEGGADNELGVHRNRSAFEELELLPSRLVDVTVRDTSVTLFQRSLPAPILIAPTGLNSVFWPSGDAALARAAATAGVPFVLSTASCMSIEQVAAVASGDLWFQLYVVHHELAAALVKRARSAGYSTLVLTVDVPVNGIRHRDLRNGFQVPFRPSLKAILDGISHPRWLRDYLKYGQPKLANFEADGTTSTESQAALLRREMDASFDWDDLRRLRDIWPGKLLIKGILTGEDARRCVAYGADGIVVSNHGGRQLADLPTPIKVLADLRHSIPGSVALLDGGIQRGADIVKAVALGASAVMIGRAALYGLAHGGEAGVTEVLAMLKMEVDRTLALIGKPTISRLSGDDVSRYR